MRFESIENVSLFFMSENYKSQGCVHQKSFISDALQFKKLICVGIHHHHHHNITFIYTR